MEQFFAGFNLVLLPVTALLLFLLWFVSDYAPSWRTRRKVVRELKDHQALQDLENAAKRIAFAIPETKRFSENGMRQMLQQLNYNPSDLSQVLWELQHKGILVCETRYYRHPFHRYYPFWTDRFYMSRAARDAYHVELQNSSPTPSVLVVQIQAGRPQTANAELAQLLRSLSGDVRVCDPYYGTGSLLRLSNLESCQSVRFLTHTADNKEKSFISTAIRDFLQEHPRYEFRKHVGNELHDRFVVTADELIVLGHGIKDVGSKESFVVRLDRSYAADAIDDVRSSFDQKWQCAQPLH